MKANEGVREMSMSFDRDLTDEEQHILNKFLGGKEIQIIAQDRRNAIFKPFEMQQKEMTKLANDLKQVVTVEIHDEGEVKTMADGAKYKATPQGWEKIP